MENLQYWNEMKRPPKTALKEIKGGTLSGKYNIDPQWRYLSMTETFGPIGIGWTVRIIEQWSEELKEQVVCFVKVAMRYKADGEWSEEFEGIGGNTLVHQKGKVSDEGYKMAYTDAISVAMKMIGVAADIYMGAFDGSGYNDEQWTISAAQIEDLKCKLAEVDREDDHFLKFLGVKTFEDISEKQYKKGLNAIKAKKEKR